MSHHLVAIDFSPQKARAIVVQTTLRHADFLAAYVFEREEEEADADFLARIRAALPARIDSLVVGAGAKKASARVLEFPFGDARKVDVAIDFELEGQVPYNIDDVAAAWSITRSTKTSSEVLALVSPRSYIADNLAQLEGADLEPRAIILPSTALGELVANEEHEPVGVLSIGATESHLYLGNNGDADYVRTLRFGGDGIDRLIARELGIETEEARAIKEDIVLDDSGFGPEAPDPQHVELVKEGLRTLISQLYTTLKALPDSLTPSRLCVTGGLAAIPGLANYLSSELDMAVEVIDLRGSLGAMQSLPETIDHEFGPAVALLLRLMHRGGRIPLNFRRGEFAYQGDLQLYRAPLVHAAIGFGIVILLAISGMMIRHTVLQADDQKVSAEFCAATRKIVGREICDPTAAIATLKQSPGTEEGVVIPTYSAAVMFEALSKTVASAQDVKFEELDFRLGAGGEEPDRITGKAEADSFDTIEQVIASIKRDPCVQEAAPSRQQKARNSERVEFKLSVKMKCPPGVKPGSKVAKSAVTPAIPGKGALQ